ncbi:hypothetical protein [Franconibacter helveticus]|uniref:hypothetical protein n=1 Tax=Franconibacter helveticus TaxID=357240 RepID=UPI0029092338|nr:hypothetical protein [Franconibacter helveticus]MDU6926737.1 hypothetical protein [Franconibacter helveticus]
MMPLQEQDLTRSGFNKKEIEKIKVHMTRGDSLETILKELSNQFLAVAYIASGMAVLTLLTIIFGSATHIISCVIAVVFLLTVLICVIPARLGYKSWKLRHVLFNGPGYRP